MRLLLSALALLAALVQMPAHAAPATPSETSASAPLWLRYPSISPDGSRIAFSFGGNLYVVPASGGAARLLVGNGHHSFHPVWSPDSRRIAYASDVYGNFDVFVVAADGGAAQRLTTHSGKDLPTGFTPDGKEVLFTAERIESATDIGFPLQQRVGRLFKVRATPGARPTPVLSTVVTAARYDRSGTHLVYEDWKGYENDWRKHHVSPVAHDIWLYDAASGTHRRLTSFGGEDRDPSWSPDQRSVYYLSERSGSFNVWQMPLEHPEQARQVTHFSRNPVRFLSVADNGDLVFGYDGEIYVLPAGQTEPRKLSVQITADTLGRGIERLKLTQGATEIAPSPDGKEIAFIVRGDVFVASTEFGDTRRITNTPTQERSVSFSPDGRHLVFAGERDGHWNLYEASLPGTKKDVPYFFAAPRVEVRTLLANDQDNFQPAWSPDGKEVAYLENRVTLKVLDVAKGQARTILSGEYNYSYADGDQWYQWSPDGRWFLVNFIDRNRWGGEVGLIDAQGKGPIVNLTKSGYDDNTAQWARGGRQMFWFTDRTGLHGASGQAQTDVYAMFFTQEAWDRFHLEKSEFALLKEREDAAKKDAGAKGGDKADGKGGKPGKEDAAVHAAPAVQLDLDHIDDRIERLTPNAGLMRAAAMTPDGETLLFVQQVGEANEVWINRLRDHEAHRLASLPAGAQGFGEPPPVDLRLDDKGETAFVLSGGSIQKFKLPQGESPAKLEPVKFSAELDLDRSAERAYIFEHAWRQTLHKLYRKDMNGVDWAYYRRTYEKFLPFIADNYDFAECLSEMLGELNVSHTGAGYTPRDPGGDATAALGAFYDFGYQGPGLKIAEVIESGPLTSTSTPIRAGMVIESIDGVAIAPGAEFDSLLNRKAGKRVALSLFDPATGKHFDETVKAISLREQGGLLYERWVRRERAMVDKLSGGRLGYVHVQGMNDPSYRKTYSELLGRDSGKQAVIVDTRFNGGGNLHDELATLLSGKRYLEFVPRGQELGWEPVGKWTKPSIVMISESNYSDAHLFPWVYRHLGIGRLVGMPVAGTGTAVWWETQQDPSLYFGIPEVGFRDAQGEYMENALIEPDIRVPNDAAAVSTGRDQQLEAAVQALLAK